MSAIFNAWPADHKKAFSRLETLNLINDCRSGSGPLKARAKKRPKMAQNGRKMNLLILTIIKKKAPDLEGKPQGPGLRSN